MKVTIISRLLILLLITSSCTNQNNLEIVRIDFSSIKSQNISFKTYDLLTLETQEYSAITIDTINNSIEIDTEQPLFGVLNIDTVDIPIYIDTGFDLEIVDLKKDKNHFAGKGAAINNYLTAYKRIENQHFDIEPYIYTLDRQAFNERITTLEKALEKLDVNELSNHELALVNKIKAAKALNYKLQYLIGAHRKGNPIPKEKIPSWTQLDQTDQLFNLQFFEFGIYLHFVLDVHFYNELRKADFNPDEETAPLFYKKVDEQIKALSIDAKFKELLIAKNIAWSFLMTGLNASTQAMYDEFRNDYSNSVCLPKLEAIYLSFDKLEEGNMFPEIKGLTIDSSEVAISDLKGKVVYLDVWATWCFPCIKEFKFSKKIQQKFKNDEVAFVYLSIDEAEKIDRWKEFVAVTSYPNSIHLMGEDLYDISEKLQIVDIPRYFILDAQGKIVDANAPRPSSGKVEAIIRELLKKG